jgi:hypothetical protein
VSEKNEYQNFDSMMRKLIKVPHSKIKAKLEAEKAQRKQNPKGEKNVQGSQEGRQDVRD